MAAQLFKTRFLAATMHINSLRDSDPARSATVKEQGELLTRMLNKDTSPSLSKAEVLTLQELVVDHGEVWGAHVLPLVKALEAFTLQRKRRPEQRWSSSLHMAFTQDDWSRWKSHGVAHADMILHEMTMRIQGCNGKNLCEYTKKRLTALWLFVRGDGHAMSMQTRLVAQEHVRSYLARIMRNFEPKTYPIDLDPAKFTHQPLVLCCDEVQGISFLDSAMTCRGSGISAVGKIAASHEVSLPQAQPQLPQVNPQAMLQALMGALASNMGMGSGNADVRFITQRQPSRGRLELEPPRKQPPQSAPFALTDAATVEEAEDDATVIMDRLLDDKKTKDEPEDDESDEDGDDVSPKKKKEKKAKAKSTPKKKVVMPKKDTPKKKKADIAPKMYKHKPQFGMEESRKQVMCRTGKPGKGSCFAMRFGEYGGKTGAIEAAKKWLKGALVDYNKHIK